jgi:FOG: PKD repeat
VFILAASLFSNGLCAQETDLHSLMQQRGEYYFSFDMNDLKDLNKISRMISIDKVEGNTVIAYANQKEFDAFSAKGFEINLLTPPSMEQKYDMYDGSNRESYDWDSYPTYEAYEDMMFQFAADHPDKCSIIELGTLNSGRKILVAHLNNGQGDGKAKFLYSSTIHGDEVTGMILTLRLIDYLLTTNDAQVQNIMDNLDIFICPDANPDGTYHGGNNSIYGATRGNASGVDLNRHFPDFDDGPHPDGASHYEQEAIWFMDLAQEHLFTMGANYHGGTEVMNYPWDTYQSHHADDAWWQYVSREYADLAHLQNSSYMSDYNNGITNGYAWYTISGGRQDYMNYFAQCREITIECSNDKTPSASQLPNFWNYNKNSMLAYMEEALYGVHGVVTDSLTGEPLVASVTITGHDNNGSSVTSHMPAGDYHRPIKGGTYTFTYTANGYYPKSYTITVDDHETVIQNVQLVAGEGIMPDFTASATDVALGGSVDFNDATWGANLTSWAWTFEGGTPSTSTQTNPSGITYNEIGSFDVTLTVTNAEGESQSITKQNFITVSESYNMSNNTINTCNALFFDSGSANSSYGNDENLTMTFKPGTENSVIEVEFITFNTENNYDFLYIYDGSTTSATQIGRYSGSENPGTVLATNDEGALTFNFTSDGSQTGNGWAAVVRCIYSNPLEISSLTGDPEIINEGESSQLQVVVSGGSGNYTYSWTPSESLSDNTIANPVATPELPTTYTVTVSDGSTSVEGSITIDIRDLSVTQSTLNSVKVYPNPANGILNVEIPSQVKTLSFVLINNLGQEIMSENMSQENVKLQINVQQLPKGVYFMRLNCEGETSTRKVIID